MISLSSNVAVLFNILTNNPPPKHSTNSRNSRNPFYLNIITVTALPRLPSTLHEYLLVALHNQSPLKPAVETIKITDNKETKFVYR